MPAARARSRRRAVLARQKVKASPGSASQQQQQQAGAAHRIRAGQRHVQFGTHCRLAMIRAHAVVIPSQAKMIVARITGRHASLGVLDG